MCYENVIMQSIYNPNWFLDYILNTIGGQEKLNGVLILTISIFFMLGLPSTLLSVTKTELFENALPNQDFEYASFSFLCGLKTFWKRRSSGKGCHHDDHFPITEFSSNTASTQMTASRAWSSGGLTFNPTVLYQLKWSSLALEKLLTLHYNWYYSNCGLWTSHGWQKSNNTTTENVCSRICPRPIKEFEDHSTSKFNITVRVNWWSMGNFS